MYVGEEDATQLGDDDSETNSKVALENWWVEDDPASFEANLGHIFMANQPTPP